MEQFPSSFACRNYSRRIKRTNEALNKQTGKNLDLFPSFGFSLFQSSIKINLGFFLFSISIRIWILLLLLLLLRRRLFQQGNVCIICQLFFMVVPFFFLKKKKSVFIDINPSVIVIQLRFLFINQKFLLLYSREIEPRKEKGKRIRYAFEYDNFRCFNWLPILI